MYYYRERWHINPQESRRKPTFNYPEFRRTSPVGFYSVMAHSWGFCTFPWYWPLSFSMHKARYWPKCIIDAIQYGTLKFLQDLFPCNPAQR